MFRQFCAYLYIFGYWVVFGVVIIIEHLFYNINLPMMSFNVLLGIPRMNVRCINSGGIKWLKITVTCNLLFEQ